jgi:hypothetical protein
MMHVIVSARTKFIDELVHLFWQESCCWPILTHSSAALSLTMKQITELNVCMDTFCTLIDGKA